MIDVEDCDARLPSSGDPNDLYTAELLRLSLILGRVLKTIYGYVRGRLINAFFLFGRRSDLDLLTLFRFPRVYFSCLSG